MRNNSQLIGRRFFRLVVLEQMTNTRFGQKRWRCKCDCGVEVIVCAGALLRGATKSCGCYRKEIAGTQGFKHGHCGTPRYKMWLNARKRAKQKDIPISIELTDIPEIPKVCPILGIPLVVGYRKMTANSPTLDRIVTSRGYVPGNLQIISQKANAIKNNGTPEEIMRVAKFMQEK